MKHSKNPKRSVPAKPTTASPAGRAPEKPGRSAVFARKYREAVLRGDAAGAGQVVQSLIALGEAPQRIYMNVLVPTQQQLGTLWRNGSISISQEHAATQITLAEMGRLRTLIPQKKTLGKKVVISAVQGDPHTVGGRLIADMLLAEGWDVYFLGSDTPSEDLAAYAATIQADIVCLAITLGTLKTEAERAIRLLRHSHPPVKIIIGGRAVSDEPATFSSVGADAQVEHADEVDSTARKLLGMPGDGDTLTSLLENVGRNVSILRRERELSQRDLAQISDLERAYVSGVEHGKHNLTLSALHRLAQALRVSVVQLLSTPPAASSK